MKKILMLFFIIHFFSYSNYLITNSEIALFYDKNSGIENIKGDIFYNILISKLNLQLIIEEKQIITLNDYVKKVNVSQGANLLELEYEINNDGNIEVLVIPSMENREKLYIIADFSKLKKRENLKFAINIIPYYDNKYVEYIKSNNSYSYDNFYFKSINYSGNLFISKNSNIVDFRLSPVKNKEKKYQEDNLYYIIDNIDMNKPLIFEINFYKKDFSIDGYNFENNLFEQQNYISNYDLKVKNHNQLFLSQLAKLKTITSRIIVPDKIAYTKSYENLNNKMKLTYLNSIFESNFNIQNFFDDINMRKSDTEATVYYTFLYKYLNKKNRQLDKKLFDSKVSLEILSLLDYLEEIDGEIVTVKNNIESYYWYYQLIKNIENRAEFENEKTYIEEKKELLNKYVTENYILKDGIKTRKEDKKSYYKNIKYIDILSQKEQIQLLKNDYKKYYSEKYGFLIGPDDKDKIDLEYNLNFIVKLYENGEYSIANKLLKNVEQKIVENNNYLLPNIPIDLKNKDSFNNIGIYGEELYLYFVAKAYEEKYDDGITK